MAGKLLLECITRDEYVGQSRVPQVVRRIGGNDKDALSRAGELYSERAGGGCFADASFSADEDPTH